MLISKFNGNNILELMETYEELLKIKFPTELCKFIKKYNGGETPETKFNHNGISSDLKAFYGLGQVKYSYSDVEIIDYEEKKYLPFAFDSFGNQLVIDISSEEVCFQDHESGSIRRLVNSLTEFINICESSYINTEQVKSVEERERELINNGRGNIITDELRGMWRAEIEKYKSINQEKVYL